MKSAISGNLAYFRRPINCPDQVPFWPGAGDTRTSRSDAKKNGARKSQLQPDSETLTSHLAKRPAWPAV